MDGAAAPAAVQRVGQCAHHQIAMHVLQLLNLFLLAPKIELVAVGLAGLMIPKRYLGTASCLLRKYICGVVPSIFRNISIKALTLS
jgi:hypothetical protein